MSKRKKKIVGIGGELEINGIPISQLASRVAGLCSHGLCTGVGRPTPGAMCVEAAVAFATGASHNDQPECVDNDLISLKIDLNDSLPISSDKKRGEILRRIAIAQLGTYSKGYTFPAAKFSSLVDDLTETYVEKIIDTIRKDRISKRDKAIKEALADFEKAVKAAKGDPKKINTAAVNLKNATEGDTYDEDEILLTDEQIEEKIEEELEYHTSDGAGNAIAWIADQQNLNKAEKDKLSARFVEDIVKILIKLKTPGSKYLGVKAATIKKDQTFYQVEETEE